MEGLAPSWWQVMVAPAPCRKSSNNPQNHANVMISIVWEKVGGGGNPCQILKSTGTHLSQTSAVAVFSRSHAEQFRASWRSRANSSSHLERPSRAERLERAFRAAEWNRAVERPFRALQRRRAGSKSQTLAGALSSELGSRTGAEPPDERKLKNKICICTCIMYMYMYMFMYMFKSITSRLEGRAKHFAFSGQGPTHFRRTWVNCP